MRVVHRFALASQPHARRLGRLKHYFGLAAMATLSLISLSKSSIFGGRLHRRVFQLSHFVSCRLFRQTTRKLHFQAVEIKV